jgi:hypothetical protein
VISRFEHAVSCGRRSDDVRQFKHRLNFLWKTAGEDRLKIWSGTSPGAFGSGLMRKENVGNIGSAG